MINSLNGYDGGSAHPCPRLNDPGLSKLDHFTLAVYLKNKELNPRGDWEELQEQSVEESRDLLTKLGYTVYVSEESNEGDEATYLEREQDPGEEDPSDAELVAREAQLRKDIEEVQREAGFTPSNEE